MKSILGWIGTIVVFLMAWGLARAGTQAVVSEFRQDKPVRAEFLREYMSGCDEDGSMTAYCQCTFENLEDEIGLGGIARMGKEYEDTGVLPERMDEAAVACFDEL